MAKGKYQCWIEDDGLDKIVEWAEAGLTDEQMASNMGITTTTFYDWKKKYPCISDALKRAKRNADEQVENALFKAALEGNTTAMIFWLKNRRPDKWRDKREAEIQTDSTIHVTMGDDLEGYAD